MKAITILEPWASLIACGAKKIETRSWATKYRGKIAIHAAKTIQGKLMDMTAAEPFKSALAKNTGCMKDNRTGLLFNPGHVIAIADLVDCYYIVYHPGTNIDVAKNIGIGAESMTNDKHHPDFGKYIVPSKQELAFGEWAPGRYAWKLENVERIEPVPAKGQQRIWNWNSVKQS